MTNPPIPTRPCALCGIPTNETASVHGVMHQSCYQQATEQVQDQPAGLAVAAITDAMHTRMDEHTAAHMAGATVVDGVTFETPMAVKNHQDVVDARAAIDEAGIAARSTVDERTRVKLRELQTQCGSIGHVFAEPLFRIHIEPTRMCVFCRAFEPAKEAQP